MKRWIAGLMAVLILLTGGIGAAEDSAEPGTVDIQESVISPEEEESRKLAENLKVIWELTQNEDVRDLLQVQDVKDLMTEVVLKVLVWMLQDRPVTMKILAELGVGERDLRSIGKIWDSADRVAAAKDAYMESEEGRQLSEKIEALQNDPDLKEAANDLLAVLTSGDVGGLLTDISTVIKEGREAAETAGDLTREAVRREVDRTSVTGGLLLELAGVLEKSDWATESMPKLLENENLWAVITQIAEMDELDQVIREELIRLSEDPEVMDFVQGTLKEVRNLLSSITKEKPEEASGESRPAGGEEEP